MAARRFETESDSRDEHEVFNCCPCFCCDAGTHCDGRSFGDSADFGWRFLQCSRFREAVGTKVENVASHNVVIAAPGSSGVSLTLNDDFAKVASRKDPAPGSSQLSSHGRSRCASSLSTTTRARSRTPKRTKGPLVSIGDGGLAVSDRDVRAQGLSRK